jgi:hypothetical protein
MFSGCTHTSCYSHAVRITRARIIIALHASHYECLMWRKEDLWQRLQPASHELQRLVGLLSDEKWEALRQAHTHLCHSEDCVVTHATLYS